MLYNLAKPFIMSMPAEKAHAATIKALKAGIVPCCPAVEDERLRVSLWGLDFKNPVGLAAGFDKDAEVIKPMKKMGFGFLEIGSVTPKPQNGNPKPRVFRDPKTEAVVNAMGFPSKGLKEVKTNLYRTKDTGILGINVGKNKDSEDAAADYCEGIKELYDLGHYFVVNVSSPNTPGLRDLQDPKHLKDLLNAVLRTRNEEEDKKPIVLKIAPDLDDKQKSDIAAVALDCKIDGMIVSNTTVTRDKALPSDIADRPGGMSGKPLMGMSTDVLRDMAKLTKGKIPLIGTGGVASGADAYAKIKAGASLVQLYSALVFHGPALVGQINRDLLTLMEKDGVKSLKDLVGAEV